MRRLFIFTLVLCFSSISNLAYAANKRIGVLVYDGVLTSDVTAPLEVFGIASRKTWFSDYEVVTVSIEKQATITTEEGLVLGVDTWFGDAPKLDAFIATSSYDMDSVLSNESLISWMKSLHGPDFWWSSNCSGAQVLAQTGILDGKRATTWAGGEADFAKAFPAVDVVAGQNVVVDGRIITSNGSVVSYQSALTLLRHMSSASKADEVADVLQYPRLSNATY